MGDGGADKQQLTERLAQAEAMVQELAYAVSHDLQEPLRMVSSYVQLLARRYEGRLDADADEFIAFAVDGAVRMQKMIADLLEYSRVTTRGRPFTTFGADMEVVRALAQLRRALDDAGARVTHQPLPTVTADAEQLRRVFHILLSNALEHAGPSPQIRIGGEARTDEVVLHVADAGPGVPEADRTRIFAMFQSLKPREERQGTGAGLAIAKRIVERHGGRLWVDSAPEGGAVFYLSLPADKATLDAGL